MNDRIDTTGCGLIEYKINNDVIVYESMKSSSNDTTFINIA